MPKAAVAELAGTFLLVFAGCGSIALGLGPLPVAAAFGLAVGSAILVLGGVSGAHCNPAVTIGLAIAGHVAWRRAAAFVPAQLAGAVAAAATLQAGTLDISTGVTTPAVSGSHAVVLEAMLTAILLLVIVAMVWMGAPRSFAAIAVGATIATEALLAGPITGASMNPARSLGPAVVAGVYDDLLLYLAGPLIGASVIGVAARTLRGADETSGGRSRGGSGPAGG